jgi:hypothetical protein
MAKFFTTRDPVEEEPLRLKSVPWDDISEDETMWQEDIL